MNKFDFFLNKKKLSKIGNGHFISYRDDLFPFIKFFKKVIVVPISKTKVLDPIVYWENFSLKWGFIVKSKDNSVIISKIKFYPLADEIDRKYILGKVSFIYPTFIFKLLLKMHLTSGKYKVLD